MIRKLTFYQIVYNLILLLLILLNLIKAMEQIFLIINNIKIRFYNKTENDILTDSLILYMKSKLLGNLVNNSS